jgi:serine/threonine protein kinase
MAKLNSPHLIALRAAYEDDVKTHTNNEYTTNMFCANRIFRHVHTIQRSLYLVMELAKSGDLASFILCRHKNLNEQEVCFVVIVCFF